MKSNQGYDHLEIIEEVFGILKKYKFRLNPQKYSFGVTLRKLLYFMVLKRDIELYPQKVKAFVSIPPPKGLKQLRSIQGKINLLRRFIS